MSLRSLFHRLRGRKELYQVYANITYSTPERCLEHHGEIILKKEDVPSVSGCHYEILSFPVSELDFYREKEGRMEELVDRELERRSLFEEGVKAIEVGDYEKALTNFERSVKLDIFIAEIEELAREYSEQLPSETKEKLKKSLVLGYKEKYGQKRYERLPEKMREDRKQAGVDRIRDLLG